MKLFKVNGRKIAAKTIADAVEAYKAKRIDLDDASASGTAELTDIINDLLQKKEPLDINERVDVNGKRVKGQIRIFWNGGEIQLGFTPKSGDFAMLGKSSSVGVPVDRKTKTVKRSDVNKAAQAIFEFADKQTETQKSLANEKPKLLGYKLEFIEGEQSGIRKRMMNKLVDFDDMVRFLQGEEDRRQSTGAKGYDKAYIDAVYSIGGKHYRVHGARFDVGDGGDVRSRLKAETGYLDKEIEAFRKSGYSRSVKEGDCKDASDVDFEKLLASERQAVEDYREAISHTTDAKLLTVLSHILKEETEHIEELEAAREGVYEDKGLMDAEVLKTALRDSLSVIGKPINQFKGRKGVYTVLKVKENGAEKFLVTSEDVSKPGFSPAGTVENTLAEAIKTAKRYAASDSIRDGKVKQIARGIGWEVYYHDGRYYVDFFKGKPIGGHKTLQGAKEELYYAGKIPSKTAELKGDSLKAKDGIWTLPDTEEKYNKFKEIIKRRYEPKDVKKLTSELYRIWGYDELFDDLEDARDSGDIAYILKSYAKDLHKYLAINKADPKLVAKAKAELG